MEDKQELEKILRDVESARLSKAAATAEEPTAEDAVQAKTKREEKARAFQLQLDLGDEPADSAAAAAAPTEMPAAAPAEHSVPANRENTMPAEAGETGETEEEPRPKKKKSGGCLKKILYTLIVVAMAVGIAYFGIVYIVDSVGLNKSYKLVDVEIPSGATTRQIAEILKEEGIIDQPLCFRIYSRFFAKADGKYQRGVFSLSADMGYTNIVDRLMTTTPRETVTVTIPEGYTVEKIAAMLDENGVCTPETFFEAVNNGKFDYDFIRAIPTAADGEQYAGRIYRLEGYLFPDTYNFYVGSSGESVITRMLDNFDQKLTADMREQIRANGWTVDEAVIMASIIQGEAAKAEDMQGVARVLLNRLAKDSGYPKLQMDSTRDYVQSILPSVGGTAVTGTAYDTYQREGLPVGAINNPGFEALHALLNPSTDPTIMQCYFFATDYNTGITYFNKTFAEHEATCRRYRIGAYG